MPGLEEANRKPEHPLMAAGLHFWPPTLCFRGKLRSFYLFEGMGSFSLIVGGRNAIRRENMVPWPTLKTLLDSISKRMLALEPELAAHIGIATDWQAKAELDEVLPLTPPSSPARQIEWQYSFKRNINKPGIVGVLIYHAPLNRTEVSLLEWGQWLGLGQQTTMGCGRYIYLIS